MHVIVWQYDVVAAHVTEFEHTYAANGAWARLFARADGYLGTQLCADRDVPGRYLTLDRWRSAADFDAFRARFAGEYGILDERCAAWTTHEVRLGLLVSAAPG